MIDHDKHKLKIVFQSEDPSLFDCFKKHKLLNDARGGTAYEYDALKLFSQFHDVDVDGTSIRGIKEKSLKYLLRIKNNNIEADIFIKTPSVIVHGKINKNSLNIGIIHHIYLKRKKGTLKGRLSLAMFHKKLKELDCIIAVSKFWEDYFRKIGCKKVITIYNSFDLKEFYVKENDVKDFIKRYGLDQTKPLIYLGFAHPDKGVIEVYNALRNKDLNFIMSGPENDKVNIPVKRLFLNRYDYIRLLKSCDLSVLMPKIEEGWSRSAHESLLCKTPVIGSGTGGMKELLFNSGQIICNNINDLPDMINDAIKRKKLMAETGYNYVKQFNKEYFESKFISLLNSI